jgi:hypothetical protein
VDDIWAEEEVRRIEHLREEDEESSSSSEGEGGGGSRFISVKINNDEIN